MAPTDAGKRFQVLDVLPKVQITKDFLTVCTPHLVVQTCPYVQLYFLVHRSIEVFKIDFGVRQGSVLSPLMFALYVDDLGKLCV